ncbi:unannotated protein [freshwater metagenome]|uniref:Unannotated protein n=1 Tax=freshwater metagenome TaxID=449393 RepID=A0A6J7FQT2_9ZZZZ
MAKSVTLVVLSGGYAMAARRVPVMEPPTDVISAMLSALTCERKEL